MRKAATRNSAKVSVSDQRPKPIPQDDHAVGQAWGGLQRRLANAPTTRRLSTLQTLANDQAATIQRIYVHTINNPTDNMGRAASASMRVSGPAEASGHNSPAEDPEGWDFIAEKFEMNEMRRMHLLNGRLGGPGTANNLTPGLDDVNHDMVSTEVLAQNAANAGATINYRTTVTYGHAADPDVLDPTVDPNLYYPSRFEINWSSDLPAHGPEYYDSGQLDLPPEKDTEYSDDSMDISDSSEESYSDESSDSMTMTVENSDDYSVYDD